MLMLRQVTDKLFIYLDLVSLLFFRHSFLDPRHHYSIIPSSFGHRKSPDDFWSYRENFIFWKIATENTDIKGSILEIKS